MKKLAKKYGLRRVGGKQKGFTLVELLIVMIILAILATVVTLSLTGAIGRGEATACQQEYLATRTAVIEYYAENNMNWPAGGTEPGLTSAELDTALEADRAIEFGWLVDGLYLDATPGSDTNCSWTIAGTGDAENPEGTAVPAGSVYTPYDADPTDAGSCPCYLNVNHGVTP